jgi:hypothetical protein
MTWSFVLNQVDSKNYSKDLYPFGSLMHELDLQIYLLKTFLKIDFGLNNKILVLEFYLDQVNILNYEHILIYEKKLTFYRFITLIHSWLVLDSTSFNHKSIDFLDRVAFLYSLIVPFCKGSFYYNNKLICIIDNIVRTTPLFGELLNLFTNSDKRVLNCGFKILDLDTGVEFLGWIIRIRRTGELVLFPTGKRWLQYKKVVKAIFMNARWNLSDKVYRLRCLAKYWRFSNQLCDMKKNRRMRYRLKQWCFRYLKKYTTLTDLEGLVIINYIL